MYFRRYGPRTARKDPEEAVGEDSVVEDILFEDIKMDGVLTPFVVNSYTGAAILTDILPM